MADLRLTTFYGLLWAILLWPLTFAVAESSKHDTTTAGEHLAFSSALKIAATQSLALKNLATNVPAVPIPRNITKLPKSARAQYEVVQKLAHAPPIQQQIKSMELPEPEVLLAEKLAELVKDHDPPSDLVGRATPLRVMIVGDSITQGQQGDFTWRYRIWQWFQSQNINVKFVGPYTGTFQSTTALATGPQPPTPPPPLYLGPLPRQPGSVNAISVNGGYASSVSSAFLTPGNNNHFSNWGRALGIDAGLIANVLAKNPADLILLALGFNDMGWFYSDAYGTIESMATFITNARSTIPNIKIAVANVPQRTFIRPGLITNISTYNQLLPGELSKLSTSQSPLVLVDFEGNYACGTTSCPAGYDGLHPNAWGEYQIANAFSKALIAGYGIGSQPLAIPAQNSAGVIRSIGTPQNFQVFTSPQGVSATWDAVYGAYSYEVSISINGGGGGFSNGTVVVNRFDSTWSLPGWTYAISVAAACGDQLGPSTGTQTAVAQPQLAPPPTNVNVQPSSGGFTVTWDPPTGPYTEDILEYNIIYWDTDPSDCQFISGAAFESSPAVITGLKPGANYLIAPVTWNSNGQGLPVGANNAVPGGGTPGTPSGLSVVSDDPTSVYYSWEAVSGAAGYNVFIRNATGGNWQSLANTTQNCGDCYFLFPGTWNYEFSVAAWNGNDQSPQAPGVVAPSPASTVTEGSPGPTCGPPPEWCPSFYSAYNGPYVGGSAGGGASGGGVGTTGTPSTIGGPPPTKAPPGACTTTSTVISQTPKLVCGTKTMSNPSPSHYSFQLQVTGNIQYGQLQPTNLVSAISKACSSGCGGALAPTTITTTYIDSVYPTAYPPQATLIVPYEVSFENVNAQDTLYVPLLEAIMDLVNASTVTNTFTYYDTIDGHTDKDGFQTTNYEGPSFVQAQRMELDTEPGGSGAYTIEAGQFTYQVTSYTESFNLSCAAIEGPVGAALGAIPDVGVFLGFIGSLACTGLTSAGARRLL